MVTAQVTSLLPLQNDGKLLWHFNTGQSFKRSPMVYMVDGHQRFAFTAGQTVISFGVDLPDHPALRQIILKTTAKSNLGLRYFQPDRRGIVDIGFQGIEI
ncbi:MAG TPA: hypothetical protein VK638_22745 [Edaphobacter sp.]|nr:hypothetical protein [Edaphobacter sp.]